MALWQADQRPLKFPSDDSAPSHGLSQVVLEGSLVNLDVTSPAATLALTLMFLKTNERAVADMLVLPDTTFNLDFIRPSCILLRVVARSLIMWESIEPTQEWVMKQMPNVVRTKWPNALKDIKAVVAEGREFDHEAVLLAHIHAVAGACLALGLRYAGIPTSYLPCMFICRGFLVVSP
jgi:anaphase-promoting complex subunit 1